MVTYREALTRSHVMSSRLAIYDGSNNLLSSPTIVEGFVRIDRTSTNRRQLDFTAHAQDLVPSQAEDILHPLSGTLIRAYRGIASPIEVEFPLGVFVIEDSDVSDSGDTLRIDVKAFDLSKNIQRNRWTEIYVIEAGTNVGVAIREMLADRDPNIFFNWDGPEITSATTPPMIFGTGQGGGDPWEDAGQLAESIGHELYFDELGNCSLTRIPNLQHDTPVLDLAEGVDSILLDVTRRLTREDVFNHVIVYATGPTLDEPIRIDVYDDNPNSPTYYLGPFGDVPTYLQSQTILTEDQAYEAAYGLLQDKLGAPEKVEVIMIADASLDVGNVITVTRERLNMNKARHIIDQVTIPLAYDQPQNLTCRENRT